MEFSVQNRIDILKRFQKRHAFVIGIDYYPHLYNNHLQNAARDAEKIAYLLKVKQGFDHVLLMTDVNRNHLEVLFDWLKNPDRPNRIPFPPIEAPAKIDWIELNDQAAEGDDFEKKIIHKCALKKDSDTYTSPTISINSSSKEALIFYFAGHGIPGEVDEGPSGYLTPSDLRYESNGNSNRIPMEDLYQALVGANCHHTLLVLDCCFAGKFKFAATRKGARGPILPMYKRRFDNYIQKRAWQVLVSSGPDQEANDVAEWTDVRNHSPFAQSFMEALNGEADIPVEWKKGPEGDGLITANEIFHYVHNKVERITGVRADRIQHPGFFPMPDHEESEFIFVPPLDKIQFPIFVERAFYVGFNSYTANDRNIFFGRQKAIESLLHLFAQTNVLVVSGASAVGKSSTLKAGFAPVLKDLYGFQLFELRPTNAPFSGSIIEVKKEGSDEVDRKIWTGIRDLLETFKTDNSEAKKRLILIDQYERYFAECTDETEKKDFENALVSLVDQYTSVNNTLNEKINVLKFKSDKLLYAYDLAEGEKNALEEEIAALKAQIENSEALKIIIGIRSDFDWELEQSTFGQSYRRWSYGPPSPGQSRSIIQPASGQFSGLRTSLRNRNFWEPKTLKQFLFRLKPMDLEEMRECLEGPAKELFFEFEEGLVDQILEDADYAPGALPMLSFTMQQMYKKAKSEDNNRIFKIQDYQELGGIVGAIRRKAEDIYDRFDLKDPIDATDLSIRRKIMRRILLRLIQINEGQYTSRRVYLEGPADTGVAGAPAMPEIGFWLEGHQGSKPSELDYGYPKDFFAAQVGTQVVHREASSQSIVDKVLEVLEANYLIVIGQDTATKQRYIELAHDSLIQQWPTYQQWIKDFGKEQLTLQRQLWQSTLDHLADQRKPQMNVFGGAPNPDPQQDLATSNTLTWEFNPKLEELSNRILDPRQKWIHRIEAEAKEELVNLIWGEAISLERLKDTEEKFNPRQEVQKPLLEVIREGQEKQSAIITARSPDPDPLLQQRFLVEAIHDQMDNWLNRAERAFVQRSWTLRNSRIQQLKQERDVAQRMAKRAISESFAFPAEIIQDRTTAFRLARYGAFGDPSNPRVIQQLMEGYYFPIQSKKPTLTYRVLIGHNATIWDMKFHPRKDRSILVSSDGVSLITVWDADAGRELLTLKSTASVKALCFTKFGKYLLTGNEAGTIEVWDYEFFKDKTPKLTKTIEKRVRSIHISPNNQLVVSASNDDTIRIWQFSSGDHLELQEIRAWNVRQGDHKHVSHLTRVMFVNDNQVISTTEGDNYMILWDISNGHPIQKFEGHGHLTTIKGLRPKHDPGFFYSVSHDNTIRKWDLGSGNELLDSRITDYFAEHFNDLAFSPDGQYLVTADGFGFNRYRPDRDLSDRDLRARVHGAKVGASLIEYSPNGKIVALVILDNIYLWDLESKDNWKVAPLLKSHNQYRIETFDLSPSGTNLIYKADDNVIRKYNLETEETILFHHYKDENLPASAVKALHFSPDGSYVAIGVQNRVEIRNWEGKLILTLDHVHPISYACFGTNFGLFGPFESQIEPDGRECYVFSVDVEGNIKRWGLGGLAFVPQISEFQVGKADIGAKVMAVSPRDNNLLVSSHHNNFFEVRQIDQDGRVHHTEIHADLGDKIRHLAFSPDGKLLAVCGGERFRVYTVAKEQEVFTGVSNNTIYKMANLEEIYTDVTDSIIWQVFFSEDNRFLGTVSESGFCKVWDAQTGAYLYNIGHQFTKHGCPPIWGAFDLLGQGVFIASKDRINHYWIKPSRLLEEVDNNNKFNIGHFTPEQIEKYKLEENLDIGNLIIQGRSEDAMVEANNEDFLFSLAEYYFFKAKKTNRQEAKDEFFGKAKLLYQRAQQKGKKYSAEFYVDRLNRIPPSA